MSVRSVYVLLLCLYVPYTCYYYICNGSEILTNRSLLFTRQAYYSANAIRVCVPLFQQRSDRWRQTVSGSIASDTNVSFKQLCSRVAAITGPWNCVVYRDIRLLKAHPCSSSFSSNCVGDAAPKRSSGCGFVLTNLRHTSARGHLRNVYT